MQRAQGLCAAAHARFDDLSVRVRGATGSVVCGGAPKHVRLIGAAAVPGLASPPPLTCLAVVLLMVGLTAGQGR